LSRAGTNWTLTSLIHSTNEAAFVLGVRPGNDVLAGLATTNVPDGALYSLAFLSNVWVARVFDTSASHRGLGTLFGGCTNTLRLLDAGGIQVGIGGGV
jgi:hypothetical protein